MITGSGVFAILGVIALLLVVHPFVTYPITLALFAPRTRRSAPLPVDKPQVAICMCAYNEEAVIADKLAALLAMAVRYGRATVHVYVDGCTDRTAALAQPFADRIDLVISPERLGKTHGMTVLLDRSSSDLVLFSDANVIADVGLLDSLAAPFADPQIGCVSARLIYSNANESATSYAGAVYWGIEERIKRIESRTIGVVGVDGATFVVRRALYQPPPAGLIDDFYVTLKVLIAGARVTSIPEAMVEERSAVDPQEELRRKRRIACQALNVHKTLWPELKTLPPWQLYGYLSHRLVKWLMPFFLAFALACFAVAAILQWRWPAAIVCAAGVAAVAIGGRLRVPGLAFVHSATLSLYGVALGVIESLILKTSYATWEPATSVRAVAADPAG